MDRFSFSKFVFPQRSSSSDEKKANQTPPPQPPPPTPTPSTVLIPVQKPRNPLDVLQERLLMAKSPEEVTFLLPGFIAELGASARFRCSKEILGQIETATWLCLSGGHSREQPSAGVEDSGTVCGHVFARNEIVYRCRTCGMDDTCVLCARCFNADVHRNHDILFSVSGGNGCCDCGDKEAWKHPIGCALHSPLSSSSSSSNASASTSTDLSSSQNSNEEAFVPEISRVARLTLGTSLSFVAQQLRSFTFPRSWNTTAPSEALLSHATGPADPHRPFAVLVYNDDSHTFDEVIRALVQTTGCTREEAKARADNIDQVGRETVLISDDLQQCLRVCHHLEQGRLRCTVEKLEDVFHQSLTPVFLDICTKLAKQDVGYRRAICEELCFASPVSNLPERLDSLLRADPGLWKSPRNLTRDLFFASLLMDSTRFKEVLGARFIAHYPVLVENYLKHDPEPDSSMVTISLQLFTTPSVVHYLVTKCDLLGTIIGSLKAFYSEAIPANPTMLIDCEHSAFMNDRYSAVFYDLKYILSKPSVAEFVVSNPKHLHNYLSFLALFQGMHPQLRALTTHVEYESQLWIKVFSLSMFITRTIPLFAGCFPALTPGQEAKHPLNLGWAINTTKEYIKQWQLHHVKGLVPNLTVDPSKVLMAATLHARFGEFPVIHPEIARYSELAPSFHNMLHWFLSSLIKTGMAASPPAAALDLAQLFKNDAGDLSLLWLLEGPLRVHVVLAQVAAGLWRKNGMSMANQAYQYKGFLMRDQAYDNDLLMLQVGAVVLGAEHITAMLMDRFSLSGWFTANPVTSFDENQCTVMTEEFFCLLIGIINERWVTGFVSSEDKLRTHFIQHLIAGPQLHSDLTKKIEADLCDHPQFDEILLRVADKKLSSGAEHENFVLKDENFKYFDPYFFHFRRSDREKAEEAVRQRRKREKNPQPYTPPQSVPLKPTFAPIENMLHSKSMTQIIFYGLWHNFPGFASPTNPTEEPQAPPKVQSATVFDTALHLLSLALTHSPQRIGQEDSFVAYSATIPFEISAEERITLVELLVRMKKHPQFPKEEESRFGWFFSSFGQLGNDPLRNLLSTSLGPLQGADDGMTEEERKKKLAKEHRERIMKEFQTKQQNFMKKTAEEDMDSDDLTLDSMEIQVDTCFETEPCILCRNPTDTTSGRSFGILGYIQPSSVLKNVADPNGLLVDHLTKNDYCGLDHELSAPADFATYQTPPAGNIAQQAHQFKFAGCHVSSCGHFMHTDCFEKFESIYIQGRAGRRLFFLCPLCKSFGDILIPVVSTELKSLGDSVSESHSSDDFDRWLKALPQTFLESDSLKEKEEEEERERSNSGVFSVSRMKAFLTKLATSPPTSSPFSISPTRAAASFLSSSPRSSQDERMDFDDPETSSSLTHRSSTKRPRSPSPTLSSANAASLSKMSVKFEQVYSPFHKSKVQNLVYLLDSYTYTLKTTEVALRGKPNKTGSFFFESLSRQEKLFVTAYANLIDATASATDHSRSLVKHSAWNLLRKIIWCGASEENIQELYQDLMSSKGVVLLEDSFTNLVRFLCISPMTPAFDAYHFVRLFFLVEVTKITLGLLNSSLLPYSQSEPRNLEEQAFQNLVGFVRLHALRSDPNVALPNFSQGLSELKIRLLPFLRQASLVLHTHFNLHPSVSASSDSLSASTEYEKLCSFLGLPTQLNECFDLNDSVYSKLISGWCFMWHNSDRKPSLASPMVQNIVFSPLMPKVLPIFLFPLPQQYEAILIESSHSRCPVSSNVRSDPALCLLCGQHSCCQSLCCSLEGKGPCVTHAETCHGSSGLIILDKQCVVVALHEGKGAFQNAPFFDAHGEADPGLRRGRPLALNRKRYDHLRDLWVSHKLHGLVSPKLERGHADYTWESL